MTTPSMAYHLHSKSYTGKLYGIASWSLGVLSDPDKSSQFVCAGQPCPFFAPLQFFYVLGVPTPTKSSKIFYLVSGPFQFARISLMTSSLHPSHSFVSLSPQ